MASPSRKRFEREYQPIYDAIASLDVPKVIRERVAGAVGKALYEDHARHPHRMSSEQHKLFVLLASDPLLPCVGYGDDPCPDARVIRVGMHLNFDPFDPENPLGRSQAWEMVRHPIRCVSCGAKHFTPGHRVLT